MSSSEDSSEDDGYPSPYYNHSYPPSPKPPRYRTRSYTSSPPSKRLQKTDSYDRISTLPDSILHHILSFRDMAEVLRTSELSKRWRSLWKTVPSINIRFDPWCEEYILPKFVNRILLLRNEDVSIDKLRLSCKDLSYSNLSNWIKIAERRNLRELYVFVPSYNVGMGKFPACMFTSDKIKVVKLGSNSCRSNLRLPISMCSAPHLKTIDLNSIVLPKCNSRRELIISCPVLEELRMKDCNHYGISTLRISAPQLKSLVVENRTYGLRLLCEISIFTPSLESLVLKGFMYPSYSFGKLESLVNAYFSARDDSMFPIILHQVLQGLHNVRNLKLAGRSMKEDGYMSEQILEQFYNLRSLQIIGFRDPLGVGPFRNLLENTPFLEHLELSIDHLQLDKGWREYFQSVSCLKSIEIEGVEGSEIELHFFEFVLGKPVVLETFFLSGDDRFYKKTKKERRLFSMKLQSLRRASPKAQLLLD